MKRKFYILILLLVILQSCNNSQNPVVETVSLEDLMGRVDVEENDKVDLTLDSIKVELESDGSNLSNLILSVQSQFDTISLSKSLKFDRYGYSSSKKISFINKTDKESPLAEVYEYNFSDSIKLNNAFYNWLDCYGTDCIEISLKENKRIDKNSPFYTVIYDTTIVYIKYSCEHKSTNWKPFQDSILKKYGHKYRYALETNCRGKLIWK